MTTPLPMPADSEDPNDFADRDPDRVLDQTQEHVDPAARTQELDAAEVNRALGQDPQDVRNATDPEFEPGQDAPG